MWLRRMAARRSTSIWAERLLAGRDLALGDHRQVAVQPGQRGGGVEHRGPAGVGVDPPGVADLAAALGVERRASRKISTCG